MRNRARSHEQNSIRIKQVGRNHVVWKGIPGRQAVARIERQFGRVVRFWNARRGLARIANAVRQRARFVPRKITEGLPGSGEIRSGDRSGLRWIDAADEPAPFLAPEEECLAAVFGIEFRNEDRAADFATEYVQAKLRNLDRSARGILGKIGDGIEVIVAVELPRSAVKLIGA